MIQKTIYLLFFSVAFSSCIAHKDIVNFQGEAVSGSKIKEINNKPYRLKVDDILFIDLKAPDEKLMNIFKQGSGSQGSGSMSEASAYSSGYSIDKQGFISIPYLEKLNVLGYTTDEVAVKVKEGLTKYFVSTSDIFVNVKLAGFKYTILGEVGSVGTKIIYQNTLNIIDAIANAGDVSMTGNKKEIEIIRQNIDGVQKMKIDITTMEVFNSDVFYLQPNDIIYVPPLKQKSLGIGTTGFQTLTTLVSVLSIISTTYLLIKNL